MQKRVPENQKKMCKGFNFVNMQIWLKNLDIEEIKEGVPSSFWDVVPEDSLKNEAERV